MSRLPLGRDESAVRFDRDVDTAWMPVDYAVREDAFLVLFTSISTMGRGGRKNMIECEAARRVPTYIY